ARGVVHRDLKPSNVMLVTRGRDDEFVKVLDFGIAKVRGVALTSSGMVFGTPEYMSPEQLRGRELDGRSDLYGLGVVLFEMLTGRLPFAAETPEQLMTAHLEALPPTLSEAAPDAEVPRELEALVARLLAKDPAARPATAEELSELLAAALGDAPATAVGGKKSDPPGRARSPIGSGEARLRAALAGAIIGTLAVAAIVVALTHTRVDSRQSAVDSRPATQLPTTMPPPPTAPKEDARGVDELEHQFLSMKSSLSPRDRRAALRALYARIDAGGGSAGDRERRKRDALIELIRQHAN
ncbi:MAG: serine/threonine protein kinase, partial [bacterium]|nr:serine/threonine protein kinase [bacterium]